MSARTAPREARARIFAALAGQLDRLIPDDEGVPLQGATFADFEDQVEALAREALPVVLPERAAEAVVLAEQLKDHLWDGRVDEVIALLQAQAERLGVPQESDGPDHPWQVLGHPGAPGWAPSRPTGITWTTRGTAARASRLRRASRNRQ